MPDYKNLQEEKQYKILFKEFYIPLVIFANQYTRDRQIAEDIVQEIFVQIWEKELKFENDLALRTYLYRSTQNRCLNHIRHQKIQLKHEADISQELRDAEPDFLNTMIREEVYRELLMTIDYLPAQCKKICQLTLEGKKPSEIAEIMGLAVETVKKQKKIALKRIQHKFGKLSIYAFIAHILFTASMLSIPLPVQKEKGRPESHHRDTTCF